MENIIGTKALDALKDGGVLHIWRNVNPHNQWIEDKNGETVWHSDDENRLTKITQHFTPVSNSAKTKGFVFHSPVVSHSTYKLKT